LSLAGAFTEILARQVTTLRLIIHEALFKYIKCDYFQMPVGRGNIQPFGFDLRNIFIQYNEQVNCIDGDEGENLFFAGLASQTLQ